MPTDVRFHSAYVQDRARPIQPEPDFRTGACCANCSNYDGQRCRRYAPRPNYNEGEVRNVVGGAVYLVAVWPLTEPTDWCGEFRPLP